MWPHVTYCDLMWPHVTSCPGDLQPGQRDRELGDQHDQVTPPPHLHLLVHRLSGDLNWPHVTSCDLMWPHTDLAPDPHHRHPALLLPRLHELQDLLRDPEKQICTHSKTLKCTIIHPECTIYFQLLSGRQSKKRQSECTLGIINNLYKWKDLCQLFENIISQIAIVP